MVDALLTYLPEDRAYALARGVDLPTYAQGSALFADISGFTPLTEALTQTLGPREGIETLTDQINAVYAQLTAAVVRWRGSVIGFAGDGMTCWFDENDGPAAPRAAACALDLQAAMAPFVAITLPGGHITTIALKVAVASGPAHRLVVGDPSFQQLDVLAGATLVRMATGEQFARPGEVILDAPTVAALGPAATLGPERPDPGSAFFPLLALEPPPTPPSWEPVALPPDALRPWVQPLVWERHQAGLGAFLTELRPAVALFLRFGGLDFDGDERAADLLDALVRRTQAICGKLDGALLQLTLGDKGAFFYATFGALVAHEDDARRTALAALALHAAAVELGLPPVQIGISQGTLRCGSTGGPTRQTYAALGDEVNLAVRLMSRAAPGETLLSGRVRQALGDAFLVEARGLVALKGKAEPLPVFALTGITRRRAVRLQEPVYSLPMVGRERELAHIQECFARALAGQGQVVVIEAEAGMGKSRLIAEAVRLARRAGCVGYGGAAAASETQTSYLAWRPIVQALLDIDPDTPARRLLRQLAGRLEERVPERAEALPLLDLLLERELPENEFTRALTPQQRKAVREALLLELLIQAARKAGAEGSALLLVLEDAHWLDALSHDLLLWIAREATHLPLLLLVVTRPPQAQGAALITTLPHATTLRLEGLGGPALEGLVRAKLGQLYPARSVSLPPGLVATLAERAQGNPFCVEELLSYIHDRGITPDSPEALARLELPDSMQRLVLARIDQLAERERATLRVASVVGRLFRAAWLPGFAPDLGDLPRVKADLDRLSQLDLTALDAPEPELTYLFKHVVTQEVAYGGLPQGLRAKLHGALADWLESAARDSPPLDLLAYHYDRSDNLPKRRDYLRRAGEAAAAQYANAAAIDYLSRALALAPDDDVEERWALLAAREDVYALIGEREPQKGDLSALTALAKQQGDCSRQGVVLLRWAWYYELTSAYPAAIAAAQQALALGDREAAQRAVAYLRWGMAQFRLGEFDAARAQLTQALEEARAAGDRQTEIMVLRALGGVAIEQGNFATARSFYKPALALAQLLRHYIEEANALGNLGALATFEGDYRAARLAFEQAIAICRVSGDRRREAHWLVRLGWAERLLGAYEVARQRFEGALEVFRVVDDQLFAAEAIVHLGCLAAVDGDHVTARERFEQALATFRSLGDRSYQAWGLCELGATLIAFGRSAEAIHAAQEATSLYGILGDRINVVSSRTVSARALWAQQNVLEALSHIDVVFRHLNTGPLNSTAGDAICVYLSCYELLRDAGDVRAGPLLEQAYALLTHRAARLDEGERRTYLENVPWNRAIVEAWRAHQQTAHET